MISLSPGSSEEAWWEWEPGSGWWTRCWLGRVSQGLPGFLPFAVARSIAGVVLLSLMLGSNPAWAISEGPVVVQVGHGLRMRLDYSWFENGGYRPLQVRLAPTRALVTDRCLDLEIEVQSPPNPPLRYRQSVTVPRGNNPVEVTMSVPQFAPCVSFTFRVYEDGEQLPALNSRNRIWSDQIEWPEWIPRILYVDHRGQSLSASESLLKFTGVKIGANRHAMTQKDLEQNLGGPLAFQAAINHEIFELSRNELPDHWRDYTCVDVVVLNVDDALLLRQRHPQKWRAIRQWTAAGGNLLIFGLKQDATATHPQTDPWGRMPTVHALLNFPTPPPMTQVVAEAFGWTRPDIEILFQGYQHGEVVPPRTGNTPRDFRDWSSFLQQWGRYELQRRQGSSSGRQARKNGSISDQDTGDQDTGDQDTGDQASGLGRASAGGGAGSPAGVNMSPWQGYHPPNCRLHFLWRPLQMGRVVAISEPNTVAVLESTTLHDWYWIDNTALKNRTRWVDRHGFSLQQGNPHFVSFLLPGAGQAPVTSFRVLISLFVILIGPVNYLWLHRLGRVHLMILTVPLGSLAVTVGLFAHGLMGDGLGTRVRARSVTYLDQQQGEAAQWTRLSYYAGLRPLKGLSFSNQTAVLPLDHLSLAERSSQEPIRDVRLETTSASSPQQRFTQGWLAARRPMQLVTYTSQPTQARLEVTEESTARGSLSMHVTNRLGSTIRQLVLRDRLGKLHFLHSLRNGRQQQATAASDSAQWREWSSQWQTLCNQSRLWQDQSDSSGARRPVSSQQPSLPYVRLLQRHEPPAVNPQTSLLEQGIERALAAESPHHGLEAGEYVAVVERPPHLELGGPSLKQEQSFHVVFGRW